MEETCHARLRRNLRYASLKRDPESVIPKLLLPMTPRYALEPLSGRRNLNFGSEAAERV